MIANYHTHTWRCKHAKGTETQYIESAIQNGFQILGFSDHTPYFFPEGYESRIRMTPDQLPDYVQTLEELKKRYSGQIEMHIGLEAEYFPDLFPELLAYLREHSVSYLILGQHYLGNGIGEFYSGEKTTDESLLNRYCNQCMEAMNTGLFTYIAHPDLFHFVGDEKIYRQHMRQLCREANSCKMPLEMNLAGLKAGIQYPNPVFWEVAAEENCMAILGVDAHDPNAFDCRKTEEKALQLVKKLGLHLLSTAELKPIG